MPMGCAGVCEFRCPCWHLLAPHQTFKTPLQKTLIVHSMYPRQVDTATDCSVHNGRPALALLLLFVPPPYLSTTSRVLHEHYPYGLMCSVSRPHLRLDTGSPRQHVTPLIFLLPQLFLSHLCNIHSHYCAYASSHRSPSASIYYLTLRVACANRPPYNHLPVAILRAPLHLSSRLLSSSPL